MATARMRPRTTLQPMGRQLGSASQKNIFQVKKIAAPTPDDQMSPFSHRGDRGVRSRPPAIFLAPQKDHLPGRTKDVPPRQARITSRGAAVLMRFAQGSKGETHRKHR